MGEYSGGRDTLSTTAIKPFMWMCAMRQDYLSIDALNAMRLFINVTSLPSLSKAAQRELYVNILKCTIVIFKGSSFGTVSFP